MPKTLKIIIFSIIGIAICYFTHFFFNAKRYGYHIEMDNYKPYFWIFKDSAKKDVDTNIFIGCIRKRDILYHYIYKHNYYVSVWEFKDLDRAELKRTSINQNVNLDDVKFESGETLNKHSSLEITVRFGSFFKSTMDINLDKYSKIEKNLETPNYKGFYGIINKISFSERGKHLVLFNYRDKEYCLFLLYKGHQSFYVIMINSEQPFDESIINILNLS